MSDEYGQVGPEKPGYERDVRAIISELTSGAGTVSVKFAARSTVKYILLTTLHKIARIDADPEGFGGKDALFVGLANGACAWLPIEHGIHWGYVAQYLGQPFGDSDLDHPLADFLADVMAGLADWNAVTLDARDRRRRQTHEALVANGEMVAADGSPAPDVFADPDFVRDEAEVEG